MLLLAELSPIIIPIKAIKKSSVDFGWLQLDVVNLNQLLFRLVPMVLDIILSLSLSLFRTCATLLVFVISPLDLKISDYTARAYQILMEIAR